MGRVIDALVAYRVLKILVTPFKKTKAYQMGIIDEKGKVLIKSKEFQRDIPCKQKTRSKKSIYIAYSFRIQSQKIII